MGSFNTSYTPGSATAWDASDRLFVIGNGIEGAKSDALVMLKNGNTTISGTVTAPGFQTPTGTSTEYLMADGSVSTIAPQADGATWRTGNGAPDAALGTDNDLYLDLDSGDVYKRIFGTYTVEGNIKGPASSLSFDLQEDGDLITFDGTNWVAKSATLLYTGGSAPIDIRQPSLALHYQIALEGIFPSRNGSYPYVGEIALYPYNFAVRGWASCYGQLLPIAQNTALFALIGTIYGGDGRTTFGLPDLRGRVAVGDGNGPGLTNYQLGEKWGSENRTITVSQMPGHTHTIIYQ